MPKSVYLAFETGGTKLVAAVAGPDGAVRASASVTRSAGDRAAASFGRISDVAARLLESELHEGERLRAIGFGFGGTVRRSTNRPHLCLHEDGWSEVDVVGELRARFGVSVYVENDCKLAALAESHFGAGRGLRTLFYVTLGTGVGGGFIHNGRILACGDLGEAEIGHVVVDADGPECCCGSRGCVEALCSGPGLRNLAGLLAERDPRAWESSSLSGSGTEKDLRSERIMDAWAAGDGFATRVVEHAMGGLARALATTVNLLVPEIIVVGGGVGMSSPRLPGMLADRIRPLVVPYFRDSVRVTASRLGTAVVTQGAAVLARQRSGPPSAGGAGRGLPTSAEGSPGTSPRDPSC